MCIEVSLFWLYITSLEIYFTKIIYLQWIDLFALSKQSQHINKNDITCEYEIFYEFDKK